MVSDLFKTVDSGQVSSSSIVSILEGDNPKIASQVSLK